LPVIAVLAQRETLASCVIRIPDAFAAALAFGGVAGHAVGTEEVIVKFKKVVGRNFAVTLGTDVGGHNILPRKIKITQTIMAGFHGDNISL